MTKAKHLETYIPFEIKFTLLSDSNTCEYHTLDINLQAWEIPATCWEPSDSEVDEEGTAYYDEQEFNKLFNKGYIAQWIETGEYGEEIGVLGTYATKEEFLNRGIEDFKDHAMEVCDDYDWHRVYTVNYDYDGE